MIEGVKVKSLRVNLDERGYLMEILRSDDDFFSEFGQCYITTVFPSVVKAWHMHRNQEDNICALKGNIKLVLYDSREHSKSMGELNELFIGERSPAIVKVPPLVYHGFTSLENESAMVLNLPSEPYDHDEPDEERLPWNTSEIGYEWTIQNR